MRKSSGRIASFTASLKAIRKQAEPLSVYVKWPAILGIAGLIRIFIAVVFRNQGPYYRMDSAELLWKLVILISAWYAGKAWSKTGDGMKEALSFAMHGVFPENLLTVAVISLLAALVRYGLNIVVVADMAVDETMSFAVLAAASFMVWKLLKEDFRIPAFVALSVITAFLRFGSDTLMLMTAEYLALAFFFAEAGAYAKAFDTKDIQKAFRSNRKEWTSVGAILVLLIALIAVFPHGRTLNELTGGRILRATTTDVYGRDGISHDDFCKVRYRRPVIPVETGAEGPKIVYLTQDGETVATIVEAIGRDGIHLTDPVFGTTENLERIGRHADF